MKRISILITSLFLFLMPLSAVGYNVNFAVLPGISECCFGQQVETNKNFWDGSSKPVEYFSFGGRISCDVIFTQNMILETGLEYKNTNLNFVTKDVQTYANGEVNLNYSVFQLPILFKYSVPIKKTTSVINSVNVAFGPTLSFIAPNQAYKDDLTTGIQNFISPSTNIGLELDLTYTHVLGPGKILVGLKTDYNLVQASYKISGKEVGIGSTFSFAPMIGYTFIIKEDKIQTKVTEKNKRIKDIAVE